MNKQNNIKFGMAYSYPTMPQDPESVTEFKDTMTLIFMHINGRYVNGYKIKVEIEQIPLGVQAVFEGVRE